MNKIQEKILVTCALPYANGPIHIGHILEHIQADIWVRYKKMQGIEVYFICADDAHGTAIMLESQKIGISPENLIKKIYKEHKKDFLKFEINHDNYYSTHSKENFELLSLIYNRLKKNKFIKYDTIFQLYDPIKDIFLPDRFVKGKCPACKSKNQYGDNCEVCGKSYNALDLIDPVSTITGKKPILKKSKHIFLDLPQFSKMLKKWITSGTLQNEVVNKMQEWIKTGLKKWNISRDEPYFGFRIPEENKKYFYVWMDASIGYISTFKNLCKKRKNINFDSFWNLKSQNKIYQFIGKDIIYFHALFWPAILEGSFFRKPDKIFVHGYLTINGKKMSKSKGTFITAKNWIKNLDSDSLRYYYTSKLSSNINDIDLNLDDVMQKINTDIVNKIINLASRTAKFINKDFSGILSSKLEDPSLYKIFINTSIKIAKNFNALEFNYIIRKIIYLADLANQYIDKKSPWKIAKEDSKKNKLHDICSMGINLFRILIIFLKPVMPSLTKKVEKFLQENLTWNSLYKPLLNHKIANYKILYQRIQKKQISKIISSYKKI